MKLKKIFVSSSCRVIKILLVLSVFLALIALFLFYSFPEKYQDPEKERNKPVVMDIVVNFCDKNFGDEWVIDNAYVYNEKVAFFIVEACGSVIYISVQPENRAIIIEDIKGSLVMKKRIHRF